MNRRYFLQISRNDGEEPADIWWIDCTTNLSFWRNSFSPNFDARSNLSVTDINAEAYGNYKEITKEEANRICKEWYIKQKGK